MSVRAWRWVRSRSRVRLRLVVLLSVLAVLGGVLVGPASAITFDRSSNGDIKLPSGSDSCPTIDKPAPYEAWYNIDDMEQRGFWDPKDNTPWDYSKKLSQVICGAAQGSEIKIGMFFVRALGTIQGSALGDRPETDPEVVYKALEWVHDNRGVKIGIVLDGGTINPQGEKNKIAQRLKNIVDVYYCKNGCFNVNKAKVWPFAINHEKFLTISNTTWAGGSGKHPAILSLSGNFARSQLRNYHQEVTLIYDDHKMFDLFNARYDAMKYCATKGCASSSGFPKSMKLTKQRGIWVDPIYRHYTDAGRGTTVSFTPATQDARDFYVQQFDDVDCTVDNNIRIAMFKLTDAKAEQMVAALTRLRKRGCDISMLLTYQGGSTTISPTVVRALKKADIPTRCTAVAMHTKLILIGPEHSNLGRVLTGTQNMSVAGLRYNEEHVITLDTRAASGAYLEPMRRVYSQYMNGWYELSKDTRSCS